MCGAQQPIGQHNCYTALAKYSKTVDLSWDSFYIFILALGAVQGVVLGLSLWRSPSPRWRSNRYLALMLFFFAYRLAAELLFELGVASVHNWGYHVLLEFNWVYGPLLYCFVASLCDPGFQLKGRQWWHFLPAGVEFMFSNFIKAQNFFWDGTAESLSWAGYWGYVLWEHTPFQLLVSFGLVLGYAFISGRILQKALLREEEGRWLQQVLTVYKAYAVLVLIAGLADYLFFDYAFHPFFIFPTYIGMAAITYWLGLQGFARRNQAILLRRRVQEEQLSEYEALARQLTALMEEQHLYRNPDLTLAALSAEMGIQPYQLTHLLNGHFQQNFNDFVNTYRVAEVHRLAGDPAYAHLSLMGIAFEAGFNSKATFNRAVKKVTGKTPKELLQ